MAVIAGVGLASGTAAGEVLLTGTGAAASVVRILPVSVGEVFGAAVDWFGAGAKELEGSFVAGAGGKVVLWFVEVVGGGTFSFAGVGAGAAAFAEAATVDGSRDCWGVVASTSIGSQLFLLPGSNYYTRFGLCFMLCLLTSLPLDQPLNHDLPPTLRSRSRHSLLFHSRRRPRLDRRNLLRLRLRLLHPFHLLDLLLTLRSASYIRVRSSRVCRDSFLSSGMLARNKRMRGW